MSYIDQANDRRRQATAIVGVAAVHAAIGLAVVTGLTVAGVAPMPDVWNPFTITPDPAPTPPSPEPQPTEQASRSTIIAPLPVIDLPYPEQTDVIAIDKPADILDDGRGLAIVPMPNPTPSSQTFQPRIARPSNDRNGWITNDDYPAALLRREVQGTVAYNLIISSSGRVSACEVTRSSGNSQLDDATCRLLQRRARFEPATDGNGTKVVGSFSGTVLWRIPG